MKNGEEKHSHSFQIQNNLQRKVVSEINRVIWLNVPLKRFYAE